MRSTETQPIDDECTGGGMIDDHYARLTPLFFPFPMLWMSFHFHVAFQNPSTIHVSTINVFWKHLSSKTHLTTSPMGSRWFACPKHNITASDEHAAVQAVVAIMDGDICVKSDPKTHGSLELFMFLRLTGPPKCPYIQENVLIFKSLVLTQNTFKNSITTSLNE